MSFLHLIDLAWRSVKKFVFCVLFGAEYESYLGWKAGMLRLFSRIGLYERENLNMLPMFVNSGDWSLDIGAHTGIYTDRLAAICGPNGRVLAFEPLPELFGILTKRFVNTRHVECYNLAIVGDEQGSIRISVPLVNGSLPEPALASTHIIGTAFREYNVQSRTIDSFELDGPLTFIKIDVEGQEAHVIKGMASLIKRKRPVIQVELSLTTLGNFSPRAPFDLKNYKTYTIIHGKLSEISRIDCAGNYYLIPEKI